MLAATLAWAPALASPQVDSWKLLRSTHPDTQRSILFRYAESFREGFKRSELPHRVVLVWRYETPSGMPSPAARKLMDQLEDRLIDLIDVPGESVLVLVSTGENLREWIFYVRSSERFLDALNGRLGEGDKHSLDVHAADDSSWTTYQTFIDWRRKQ